MRLTWENGDRLVLSAVGRVLGLAFWLVTAKAKGSPLAAAALTGLLAAGTIAQLTWTGRNLARLLPWVVAVGLAWALLGLWSQRFALVGVGEQPRCVRPGGRPVGARRLAAPRAGGGAGRTASVSTSGDARAPRRGHGLPPFARAR